MRTMTIEVLGCPYILVCSYDDKMVLQDPITGEVDIARHWFDKLYRWESHYDVRVPPHTFCGPPSVWDALDKVTRVKYLGRAIQDDFDALEPVSD